MRNHTCPHPHTCSVLSTSLSACSVLSIRLSAMIPVHRSNREQPDIINNLEVLEQRQENKHRDEPTSLAQNPARRLISWARGSRKLSSCCHLSRHICMQSSSALCQACSLCLSQPRAGLCQLGESTTNSVNRGHFPLINILMTTSSTNLKLTVKLSRSGQWARTSCEAASTSKLLRLICTATYCRSEL